MNYKKTQKMNNIVRIGQLSSEKSQAGTVYHEGGWHLPSSPERTDTQSDTLSRKYALTDRISYCIDANYWKGTTVEHFFAKHIRQLVIETWN